MSSLPVAHRHKLTALLAIPPSESVIDSLFPPSGNQELSHFAASSLTCSYRACEKVNLKRADYFCTALIAKATYHFEKVGRATYNFFLIQTSIADLFAQPAHPCSPRLYRYCLSWSAKGLSRKAIWHCSLAYPEKLQIHTVDGLGHAATFLPFRRVESHAI